MDENMFEIGSMTLSHVLFESESYSYFSEALSAEIQAILADYWSVLAAAFAWPCPFSVLSDFFRFYLSHWVLASYLCSEVFLNELNSFLLRNVVILPDLCGTN